MKLKITPLRVFTFLILLAALYEIVPFIHYATKGFVKLLFEGTSEGKVWGFFIFESILFGAAVLKTKTGWPKLHFDADKYFIWTVIMAYLINVVISALILIEYNLPLNATITSTVLTSRGVLTESTYIAHSHVGKTALAIISKAMGIKIHADMGNPMYLAIPGSLWIGSIFLIIFGLLLVFSISHQLYNKREILTANDIFFGLLAYGGIVSSIDGGPFSQAGLIFWGITAIYVAQKFMKGQYKKISALGAPLLLLLTLSYDITAIKIVLTLAIIYTLTQINIQTNKRKIVAGAVVMLALLQILPIYISYGWGEVLPANRVSLIEIYGISDRTNIQSDLSAIGNVISVERGKALAIIEFKPYKSLRTYEIPYFLKNKQNTYVFARKLPISDKYYTIRPLKGLSNEEISSMQYTYADVKNQLYRTAVHSILSRAKYVSTYINDKLIRKHPGELIVTAIYPVERTE